MSGEPVKVELTSDGKQLAHPSLEITMDVPAGAVKKDQPTEIVVARYNLEENRSLFEIQPDVKPLSDVYELYTLPDSSYVFSRAVQISFSRLSTDSRVVFLQASRIPTYWGSQTSSFYKFSIIRHAVTDISCKEWNCYLLVACENKIIYVTTDMLDISPVSGLNSRPSVWTKLFGRSTMQSGQGV